METAPGMRVALYARVSTEEQREGQTIASQLHELEAFCRQQGWVIVETYQDDGWSGAVMARPALDRLRDAARAGRFAAVLINDVDRLARDVAHLGVIKRDLEQQQVQVIFRKLPAEASPTHNLMVNILGSFAEFERELILDRTRRGRRHKIEVRQEYLGSNTSYGYRYIPKNRITGESGYLEIVPSEAAVVRQMFAWVDDEHLSGRRVRDRLNDLGISPRKGSRTWAESSVFRILHNEMYAGVWYYNKHEGYAPRAAPGKPPIYRKNLKSGKRRRPKTEWLPLRLPKTLHLISHRRWQRVQQQLATNRSFSPRNSQHFYLLGGLVRCGGCGRAYVGDPCHKKFYYRCIARCKRRPTVQTEPLEQTVISAIERVLRDPAVVTEQLKHFTAATAATAQETQEAERAAHRELTQVSREEDRLLEAYRLGTITPQQLGTQLGKLNARKAAAQLSASTRQGTRSHDPAAAQRSIRDYCNQVMRRFHTLPPRELRELLRTLIRKIVFHGQSVTIYGEFPLSESAEGRLADAPGDAGGGGIAGTTVDRYGRNTNAYTAFQYVLSRRVPKPEHPRQKRDPATGRFC